MGLFVSIMPVRSSVRPSIGLSCHIVLVVVREKTAAEQRRQIETAAKLERLRKRHEADKESARRTYMDSKRCASPFFFFEHLL